MARRRVFTWSGDDNLPPGAVKWRLAGWETTFEPLPGEQRIMLKLAIIIGSTRPGRKAETGSPP
jgi:hypothetical protein